MDDNAFIGYSNGSISYCRNGEWTVKVWAIPIRDYEFFLCRNTPKFRTHMRLHDWQLRFTNAWCYMAPDHLAGRVDSSD